MSAGSLKSQLHDLTHGGTGSAVWNSVALVKLADARRTFSREKETIENSAQQLRIVLKLRLGTSPAEIVSTENARAKSKARLKSITSERVHRTRPTAKADDWDMSSSSSSSEESDDGFGDESPCVERKRVLNTAKTPSANFIRYAFKPSLSVSPDRRPSISQQPRQTVENYFGLGRPQVRPSLVSRNLYSPGTPRQPTLLFRAFSPAHNFKSRKFLESHQRPPPPPPMSSETFLEMVYPHLKEYLPEDARYPSPFISLSESPRRALEFVIKSVQKEKIPRSMAIFETMAIAGDGYDRYGGSCMPYPYLVPAICRTHNIDDLPGKYTGTGEVSLSQALSQDWMFC